MRKRKTAGENEKNQIHFAVTTQEAGSQRAVTTGQKKSANFFFPRTGSSLPTKEIARAHTGARYLALEIKNAKNLFLPDSVYVLTFRNASASLL